MRAVDDFGSSSARGGDWKDMLIRAADKVKKRQDEDRKRYREDSTPAGQARRFFDSESGQRFLNADGKMDRKSAYTDPIRYLVAHPDYTQWLGLAYGSKATPETANSAVENLKRLGVPDDVIRETASYLESEKGAKNYRPAGARDYGGPVFNITKGLTGSNLAAGIASAIGDAATFGAESGMAPGTDRVGGELAADLAGAVGNKLLLGRGINKLEDKAAEAAARKAGGKAAAKFGAKLGTRVGLNLAEDVPLSAAQMIAYGMDPKSPEFRKALALQAATSGGSAAAVTSAGPALRLASRFPATPEVAGALTGYGAAKATGQDEETARVAALAGAGAASVRRRGLSLPGKRAGLTVEAGPGDALYHGTPRNFQGIPGASVEGNRGAGTYTTPLFDTASFYASQADSDPRLRRIGVMGDESSEWVWIGEDRPSAIVMHREADGSYLSRDGERFGSIEEARLTVANREYGTSYSMESMGRDPAVMRLSPRERVKLLAWDEPVTADELREIRLAFETTGGDGRTFDAAVALFRKRAGGMEARGRLTGRLAYEAVAEAMGVNVSVDSSRVSAVLQRAGFHGVTDTADNMEGFETTLFDPSDLVKTGVYNPDGTPRTALVGGAPGAMVNELGMRVVGGALGGALSPGGDDSRLEGATKGAGVGLALGAAGNATLRGGLSRAVGGAMRAVPEETGDTDHFVKGLVFRPNDPHPPGGYVPGDQLIVGGNRPRQTLGDDGIWHPAPYTGPRPGVENAANLLGGRQVARGKKALIGRIEMEARRGTSRKGLQGEGLDRGAADAAVQFVDALPDQYTEVLGSSFVTRSLSEGDGTDRVAGQYDPSTALITISKRLTNGSSDPERVIVHEVAHHLDRFVNQADHDALVQQWQREMGNPGIMPGSGQGGEALRRAQPVLQKLEEQEVLRENLRGSRRQATPEEQALLAWSPTPEEYTLLGGLYRWQGGFSEWFAENIADRALRDQQPPAVRSAFDRVREHVKSLLLGAYNFLLRRGERDAAERVYQNLLAGKYDTLDAREMEADARLNMEADPPPPVKPPAPPAAPPPPEPEPPRMTPEESAEVDDIIERARVLTDTPRIAESILRKLLPGGLKKAALMANPAALLSTAAGKAVLTATVARENARRLYTDVWGRERSRRVNDVLAPLMRDTGPRLGPVSLQDVGRAGLEAAPPLAAYGVGEALGLEDNEKKQLAITGLMGTAAISHSINRGNLRKTPWMSAVYLAEKEDRPKFLRKGYGLLLDIIERPDQYDLSKLPPEAGTALDALQEMRQSWVAEVNAQRLDAGLPPITLRDANRMYHLWSGRPFEDVETPPSERGYTVGRIYGSGLQREMGDTFFEAMTNNPKLRVAAGGDPRAILREQLRELASMRADAIFVKALKGNPEAAVQSVNVDELRQQRDAARAARDEATADSLSGQITNALSQEKAYRSQGWQKVPGFGDNYFFSPDAIKAINDIFVDGREVGGSFMRLMDAGTSEIRQAAFVADASAWSLQGLMLAFQSPSTVLSNIPELLAASVFGTRFTDWWMRNNSALVEEFHKSGGILARETEGTEKRVRTLGDFPGIRNIESRGFDAYLPIHRIKLFKHQKDIGSLVQRTGMTKLGADLPVGAITAARYAAGGAAAYGILDSDQGDFEKMVELAILGLGSSYASRIGEGKAGRAAFSGLNPTAQRKVGVRAAKDVNRMSGVYNKAALGITNEQAQFERVFAARSPAIVRNMLTMLKLAATNPGLEGATARFYLARTVLFTAAGLGALKMSMGQDESWDPDDPNSVLNPSSGFLRANLQVAGKVAPSNPYISLFRAVLKTEDVEGGRPGEFRTLRSSLQGVAENFLGRAPDISGKVYQGAYNQLAPELGVKPTDYSSGEPMGATGLLKAAAGSFVPVTARDLYKTGVLPSPWYGMDPPKPDPNYNTTTERVLGSIVPALGANYSPETRSQESSRTEAAQVAEQFPGTTDVNANGRIDRRDLNDMDREKFDTGQPGKDLNAFKEETRGLMPDRPESDLDRYYARLSGARDTHVQKLKDLEQAVASGEISKLEWRKAYQAEQSRYVEEKKTVDKDFTAMPLTNEDGSERLIKDESGKARTMNVVEYARRSVHPEDDAVDGYFKLFDQAIGPDGKINFEKLDSLRTEFHSSLPPEVQSYVDQRLAAMAAKGVTDSEGNDVPLPTLSEYDRVKETAKPYWEVEDKHFAALQQRDPFFKQFPKYSDYKDAVTAFATETGLSTAQVEAAIARKHRALTRFNKTVTKDKRAMRGANTDLDIGLKDYYGLEEVNPYAYIARKGGDTSYDNLGPSLARRSQAPSSRRIMRFAQERGRAGTAEAVSSFRRTFLS